MADKTSSPYQRERQLLGKAIEQFRREGKLTQEDLAHKANINVSYLAKIENGYVNTTLRYMVKIAKALRVRVNDLINF